MSEKIELDEKKLNMIKIRILAAERQNIKTQEKSEAQMNDIIRAIIVEEVKKSY